MPACEPPHRPGRPRVALLKSMPSVAPGRIRRRPGEGTKRHATGNHILPLGTGCGHTPAEPQSPGSAEGNRSHLATIAFLERPWAGNDSGLKTWRHASPREPWRALMPSYGTRNTGRISSGRPWKKNSSAVKPTRQSPQSLDVPVSSAFPW